MPSIRAPKTTVLKHNLENFEYVEHTLGNALQVLER
jgi:hypothetical protein